MCFLFQHTRRLSGFTLIEMLVVIAVVGILAAILYGNYDEARQQARDKIRKSQLLELQVALELYKDENGRYPEAGCSAGGWRSGGKWAGPGPTDGASWAEQCDGEYIVGLAPKYIEELPLDPTKEGERGHGYYYATNLDGTAYKVRLVGVVESEEITYEHEFARCPWVSGSCRPTNPDNEVCGDPGQGGNVEQETYAIYAGSDNVECW